MFFRFKLLLFLNKRRRISGMAQRRNGIRPCRLLHGETTKLVNTRVLTTQKTRKEKFCIYNPIDLSSFQWSTTATSCQTNFQNSSGNWWNNAIPTSCWSSKQQVMKRDVSVSRNPTSWRYSIGVRPNELVKCGGGAHFDKIKMFCRLAWWILFRCRQADYLQLSQTSRVRWVLNEITRSIKDHFEKFITLQLIIGSFCVWSQTKADSVY